MLTAQIHAKAVELSRYSLRMTAVAGSGHPSSATSLAQIVTALMYHQMRYDPANPRDPNADRLVMSEGHAVPIVYAALADLGATVRPGPAGTIGSDRALTIADVDTLRERNSVLDGHPNPAEGVPFFDAATGSLGQGLSVAAGLAIAAKHVGSPRRVYCIIGDGESREGQIWEAADTIAEKNLNNVCAIFNCNGHGQAAATSAQQSAKSLAAKLAAFGWDVAEIDGHDPEQVVAALGKFETAAKPLAIVARTIKGWGVDQLLSGNWHGKPLTVADLDAANASLDKNLSKLAPGAAPIKRDASRKSTAAKATAAPRPADVSWPSFTDAMEAGGQGGPLKKNALATRRAYGAALKIAGDLLPQVYALDADVSNSTFSEIFAKAHADRFVECKIGEQNMVSVAAGISAAGGIPFANSFAKFLSRAYDQIEMANISRANLKLVGSHSGISLAADGPSQMAVVDVAFFRAFSAVRGDDRTSPLCWCFNPCDAVQAYRFTEMMTKLTGMCYMRTYRADTPLIYDPAATFEPGGVNLLSGGNDLAIVTAGYMVHVCKSAIDLLAKQGVRAALVDAYSFPIQAEKLIDAVRRSGGRALVVEDNYGAGLGSAVAEIVARGGDMRAESLICQRIPKSTRTPEDVLDYCGVGVNQIADHALAVLKRP